MATFITTPDGNGGYITTKQCSGFEIGLGIVQGVGAFAGAVMTIVSFTNMITPLLKKKQKKNDEFEDPK